jgi:hypothetical protein
MSFEVRRVVTGHDNNGKAVVLIDEIKPSVAATRSGTAMFGTLSLIASRTVRPKKDKSEVVGSSQLLEAERAPPAELARA